MLYATAPQDTLAYWTKGNALALHYDRSQTRLYDAATAMNATGWFGQQESSMAHAVSFYTLHHAIAELSKMYDPLEPITDEKHLAVLKHYASEGSAIARRLFFYVLTITAREARHNKSTVEASLIKVQKPLMEEYPDLTHSLVQSMVGYTKSFPDSSQALTKLLETQTQKFPLGPFCKMLSLLYYKCSWASAYGGPKWGVIADALYSFVSGEWSAEMFADTAFTLAHNTAPIFNKGMLYSHPPGNFIELLDCQRAGMVPNWIGSEASSWLTNESVALVRDAMPEMFEQPVDWEQVKALGAVGNYSHKIPKAPPKPPQGCINKKVVIDHANTAWVLDYQRKEAA